MSDRFISPSLPPTRYEAEVLTLIIEECAEVQQRATKMLRFGVTDVQPGQSLTNVQQLSQELGDLMAVLKLAEAAELIRGEDIVIAEGEKVHKLLRFMQSTIPNGEKNDGR